MARTIPAPVPITRKRTKFYVHDHYRIDIQVTDGKNVPAVLVWLYYKDEPIKIRTNEKEIREHIDIHYNLRKQFHFEHPRFEAKGDLAAHYFQDDPFADKFLAQKFGE